MERGETVETSAVVARRLGDSGRLLALALALGASRVSRGGETLRLRLFDEVSAVDAVGSSFAVVVVVVAVSRSSGRRSSGRESESFGALGSALPFACATLSSDGLIGGLAAAESSRRKDVLRRVSPLTAVKPKGCGGGAAAAAVGAATSLCGVGNPCGTLPVVVGESSTAPGDFRIGESALASSRDPAVRNEGFGDASIYHRRVVNGESGSFPSNFSRPARVAQYGSMGRQMSLVAKRSSGRGGKKSRNQRELVQALQASEAQRARG